MIRSVECHDCGVLEGSFHAYLVACQSASNLTSNLPNQTSSARSRSLVAGSTGGSWLFRSPHHRPAPTPCTRAARQLFRLSHGPRASYLAASAGRAHTLTLLERALDSLHGFPRLIDAGLDGVEQHGKSLVESGRADHGHQVFDVDMDREHFASSVSDEIEVVNRDSSSRISILAFSFAHHAVSVAVRDNSTVDHRDARVNINGNVLGVFAELCSPSLAHERRDSEHSGERAQAPREERAVTGSFGRGCQRRCEVCAAIGAGHGQSDRAIAHSRCWSVGRASWQPVSRCYARGASERQAQEERALNTCAATREARGRVRCAYEITYRSVAQGVV